MQNKFKRIDNRLVLEMEEPNPQDFLFGEFFMSADYIKATSEYNSRPSYAINPDHLNQFKEGEVISENDFVIKWVVKTSSYQGQSESAFDTEKEANKKYDEWSKYNGQLQCETWKPIPTAFAKYTGDNPIAEELAQGAYKGTYFPMASESFGDYLGRATGLSSQPSKDTGEEKEESWEPKAIYKTPFGALITEDDYMFLTDAQKAECKLYQPRPESSQPSTRERGLMKGFVHFTQDYYLYNIQGRWKWNMKGDATISHTTDQLIDIYLETFNKKV